MWMRLSPISKDSGENKASGEDKVAFIPRITSAREERYRLRTMGRRDPSPELDSGVSPEEPGNRLEDPPRRSERLRKINNTTSERTKNRIGSKESNVRTIRKMLKPTQDTTTETIKIGEEKCSM